VHLSKRNANDGDAKYEAVEDVGAPTFFMTSDMAPIALILLLFWKKEAISEKIFVSLHMV